MCVWVVDTGWFDATLEQGQLMTVKNQENDLKSLLEALKDLDWQ